MTLSYILIIGRRMSEYIDNIKDPNIKAYLDHIRQKNKAYMSICHYCNRSSIGVIAEGYLLYPACYVHTAIYERRIMDLTSK